MNRDNLYQETQSTIAAFQFDDTVADVFTDMIERSVPGYRAILSMLTPLAARYAQPHTNCYDLGCSLGAATHALQQGIQHPTTQLIAIDNSPAMIARARQHLAPTTQLHCANLQELPIQNASIVVLNFTLQFIPPDQRTPLLTRIANGMQPGGVLVLSEKITFPNPTINQHMTELHHDFKRANGYSDLEISQKRTALENVLIPETLHTHHQRLQTAGFQSIETWFQCFNFTSMLAFT